jgi:alkyl hydroperoxide reductase subunit AhpC
MEMVLNRIDTDFEPKMILVETEHSHRFGPKRQGSSMTIQLGQTAPDFEHDSTHGRIRFHEWLGASWGLFFSHPKNFTPVCTTELGEVARLRPEWNSRNVKPIGLSVDPVEAHRCWESDILETQGHAVDFPMIGDADGRIAALYEMIHPACDPTITVRSVYVIDPGKRFRLILTYPPSTGRNFAEILRAIDSLQLTERRSIATPVNWEPGEPVLISPKLSDEEAQRLFPQGFEKKKAYLRTVDLQREA